MTRNGVALALAFFSRLLKRQHRSTRRDSCRAGRAKANGEGAGIKKRFRTFKQILMSHLTDSATPSPVGRSPLSHFRLIKLHDEPRRRLPELPDPLQMLLDDDEQHCDCCPVPRSGHRIFTDSDYIYLLGGYNPKKMTDHTFTEVWRFSRLTQKWSQCRVVEGELPDCLASFSLVSTDRRGEAFIFGGTGVPFGQAASNLLCRVVINWQGNVHVYRQTIVGKQSEQLPRMYGQAMVLDWDDETGRMAIYLVGGTTGNDYNMDVWELRQRREKPDEWECRVLTDPVYNPLPGRYRLEAISRPGRIFTFGGGAPGFLAGFDRLDCFDVAHRRFAQQTTLADPAHGLPTARKCHGLVEFDGCVFIIGGCEDSPALNHVGLSDCRIINDIWKLDLTSWQWRKLDGDGMRQPAFFHSATVTADGCIFTVGGCTEERSRTRSNAIQQMWLEPPSLKHFAMTSLLAAFPHCSREQETTLSGAIAIIRRLTGALNETLS